jgi:hypothetical protein
MLAEPKSHCDLPVCQSVLDKMNDFFFSPGEQCRARVTDHLNRRTPRKLD